VLKYSVEILPKYHSLKAEYIVRKAREASKSVQQESKPTSQQNEEVENQNDSYSKLDDGETAQGKPALARRGGYKPRKRAAERKEPEEIAEREQHITESDIDESEVEEDSAEEDGESGHGSSDESDGVEEDEEVDARDDDEPETEEGECAELIPGVPIGAKRDVEHRFDPAQAPLQARRHRRTYDWP
jgi:hypothetical protein